MNILTLKEFCSGVNTEKFWAEEQEELEELAQNVTWDAVQNWHSYTMLFILLKDIYFRSICISFIHFSIKYKNFNFPASDTILGKILGEPDIFETFELEEILEIKHWLLEVVFLDSKNNGAYELFQYLDNIEVLIILKS